MTDRIGVTEQDALRYHWFDGDFGDLGDKCLSSKIVTTRVDHECHKCQENISSGSRARSDTWIWAGDSSPMSYYFHVNCCRPDTGDEDHD